MEVPVATSLKDIYPEDVIDVQTERWERLLQTFQKEYSNLPEFLARSPGRVNLIGEVCTYGKVSRIDELKVGIWFIARCEMVFLLHCCCENSNVGRRCTLIRSNRASM